MRRSSLRKMRLRMTKRLNRNPGRDERLIREEGRNPAGIGQSSVAKIICSYYRVGAMRFSMRTCTLSPTSFPIILRISAFTGSMCVPSPLAMKELWKECPSIFPLILTNPRVPKKSADPGQTKYVQPPLEGLFLSFAVNRFGNIGIAPACLNLE